MTRKDDTITLTTYDDPPASLTVSRSALVVLSKVFGDMLSIDLQNEASDHLIPVDDTKEDLEVFLPLLEGKDTQEYLYDLRNSEWEAIARLADKYDCKIVRNLVEIKGWQLEAEKGFSPFAFTLAAWTGNHKLIETAARRAILIEDSRATKFRAPPEWMEKLAAWRAYQKVAYFDHVRQTFSQTMSGEIRETVVRFEKLAKNSNKFPMDIGLRSFA